MALSLDAFIRQRPDALVASVDDEVLMMHPDSGEYFGLNSVAGFIWNMLDEPVAVAKVCEAVQFEFDVEKERCLSDTLAFIEQMVDDGLLLVSDS